MCVTGHALLLVSLRSLDAQREARRGLADRGSLTGLGHALGSPCPLKKRLRYRLGLLQGHNKLQDQDICKLKSSDRCVCEPGSEIYEEAKTADDHVYSRVYEEEATNTNNCVYIQGWSLVIIYFFADTLIQGDLQL
ncbi:UNVERIFIED_CONTAM: hypothetical protein FKN15_068403 [Acipenser sinensis]